jgi:hypothetical protein
VLVCLACRIEFEWDYFHDARLSASAKPSDGSAERPGGPRTPYRLY